MKYIFQNYAGFQRHSQLIVSPKTGKILTMLEIRTDTNPEDSKQYQLTDEELIELRDLLTCIIDNNSTKLKKTQLDIQDAEIIV